MNIQIAFFDMDSTIIAQEGIDELAKLCGKGDEVSAITQGAMHHGWNFEESLRKRIDILKEAGLTEAQLEECYANITLNEGAQELLDYLHQNNVRTVLVSGGFSSFTQRIAERLGFNENYGHELLFDNGKLSDIAGCTKFHNRIIGKEAKAEIIKHECEKNRLPLIHSLFMGDGGNDLEAAKTSGTSIAYKTKNQMLRDATTYQIDTGTLADAIPHICGKKAIIC